MRGREKRCEIKKERERGERKGEREWGGGRERERDTHTHTHAIPPDVTALRHQGGIKAVVWTDAFQMLVILAGFLALVLRGASNVGGWGVVMERAFEGRRFSWDIE